MKESKIRAALIRKQVYIAQLRRASVATPEQKEAVKAYLSSIVQGEYANTSALGFKFDLTYDAVRTIQSEWASENWEAQRALEAAEYENKNRPSGLGQVLRLIDDSAKATGGCMVWIATAGCLVLAIWLLFAVAIAILQSAG